MTPLRLILLSTLTAITGCVGPYLESYATPQFSHSYQCGNGTGFIAQIHGDRAWVQFRSRTVALEATDSRYPLRFRGTHDAVLSISGRRATLTTSEITYENCVINDAGVKTKL